VSPALSIPPGRVLAAVNFAPWYNGGYRRIEGFERFDGRPRPSDAVFRGFDIDTVAGLSLGDTVTGDTSGATGTVCGIWDDDGSFGSDVLAVTKVTGTFLDGETLNTAAYTVGSAPVLNYAPTSALEDEWINNARDDYRDDIGEVPGSGIVRGAWQRGANAYAIRDNVGATAGVLHLASSSGWTTTGITMAEYIFFDAGGGGASNALPVEGDTITGATSGATATVHRVVEHGGSTAGNDAFGYLVLTSVSGGPFQNNEKLRVGGTDRADADGANVAFAFPVGGHYRFINHNFFGGSTTYRTYGVNSVGPGFEIDENNIVSPILFPNNPITNQPTTNLPFLIEEHSNYLFMAIPGGRFVQSVLGEPLQFNGFLGAAEFGVGDEITGLNSVVGNVLVVTSERETRGLFGTGISDWEFRLIGERTGGKLYTAQKIDTVYALDDLGITSVARTDVFGDFAGSTVSALVQPVINAMRDRTTSSTIVRSSNQYRVYFNDGSGLIMFVPNLNADTRLTSDRLPVEFGFLSYPIVVRKIYNTEDDTGKERTYFCSDDGYVYEDQIGTSFDGADINAYIRTAFYHIGSPSYRKRFRRVDLELNSSKPLSLKVTSDLTYGASEISSGLADITTGDVPVIDIFAGGGFWDVDNWDEFYWDGQNISTARAELRGTGENISLLIFNQSKVARSFVLQGITYHYDLRRLQR
jgi:hypothetical protein